LYEEVIAILASWIASRRAVAKPSPYRLPAPVMRATFPEKFIDSISVIYGTALMATVGYD
jgi:hypothetical protein